jgi:TetR/AcrR family transcriptional regulator, mexJK operon transcriptional repressor
MDDRVHLFCNHESATTMSEAQRGRGRPRDLGKREAILDAATALFHARGIAATTMEAVAEKAAVSKMTVYSHFPDKPSLLAAVFERNISFMQLPELADKSDLPSSLDALIVFGERLVSFLTRPEIVKSGRLMAASAQDHPALAAAFFAAGPAQMLARVSTFLRSLCARGLVSIDEPDQAAEQLIAAWLGMSQLKQNLGVGGPPSPEEIARNVRQATRTFVAAWSAIDR